MKGRAHADVVSEPLIQRVGKSGQVSIGRQYAGRYVRQIKLGDLGVLTYVVMLDKSHWLVRDQAKIKRALAWAAKHPPKETDLDELVALAERRRQKASRGR